MIPAINFAIQGLQAYETKLNSNASNIANVSTEGFKRTRVTLSEQTPQGVNACVETINSPGNNIRLETTSEDLQSVEYSNVDLTQELPDSQLNATFYRSNLITLQTADEMTESLLRIKA